MTVSAPLNEPLFSTLPSTPEYHPFRSGEYRVSPALKTLSHDFGNGAADARIFQIDRAYERHIENDGAARLRGIDAYAASSGLTASLWRAVAAFIVQRIVAEHPSVFSVTAEDGMKVLHNRLTGERLEFDEGYRYVRGGRVAYRDGLDALSAQVQEDVAVGVVDASGDRIVAIHAVAPSHWDPSEKVGKSFNAIHEPVPQFGPVAAKAAGLLRGLTGDTVYQRLGWSMADDDRLDRHPAFVGHFDGGGASSGLFVRVERQTTVGFPEHSAYLFTIRVTFLDCATLARSDRDALARALESMSPETRRYKGLDARMPAILARLREDV